MGHGHNEEKQKKKVKGDTHPIIELVIAYKEIIDESFETRHFHCVIVVDKNLRRPIPSV